MKKIFFILFSIFILISCAHHPTNTYELNKHHDIIEYNKHRLLRISRYNTSDIHVNYIYVHSVDCKCGNVTSTDSAIYYMYNNYPDDSYKKDNEKY